MIKVMMIKKIVSLEIIFSLIMGIIAARLGYVQIIRNNIFLEGASDLWQRSFPLTPSRGYILDRNGKELAINIPSMSIAFIPFQVKEKAKTASALSPILNMNAKDIYDQINKRISIVRLNKQGRKINQEQAIAIATLNLEGVYIVQDSSRYYPYETMLSHTLGFVGIDNQGLAGIEAYYDHYLTGAKGYLNYYMDAKGGLFNNLASNIVAPSSGLTLGLTIDYTIQSILERELGNAYIKYNPESAYGIAMDPRTGEILAMANFPNFNPNKYQDYDQELYNRNLAIWKSYEPGSTFKVFSFAAAIEEGKIDMYKDTYYDVGFEYVGGRRIKSWKKGGHGLQTFLEVLQNSSNPGFVEIARRLGKDLLTKYINDFGFGKKTGVDIMGESSGIMFSDEKFGVVEQATSAFGQGISVTALQMVTGFSAIINGGYLITPSIVKSVIHTPTGDLLSEKKVEVKRQVISKETSDKMRIALESVSSLGSGRTAYIDGYRVGGKTGTAQKAKDGVYMQGNYILSYIGAAPMNDPEIVIYVALDNPRSTIQYGGTIVGPIVKTILADVIPYLGIKKQPDCLERKYTWMDVRTFTVDNYIGLEKSKVKSPNFTFEFKGQGTKVIDQLPRSGERIPQGSRIVIMLG